MLEKNAIKGIQIVIYNSIIETLQQKLLLIPACRKPIRVNLFKRAFQQ